MKAHGATWPPGLGLNTSERNKQMKECAKKEKKAEDKSADVTNGVTGTAALWGQPAGGRPAADDS